MKTKKLFSIILCLAMMLSVLPIGVFAAAEEDSGSNKAICLVQDGTAANIKGAQASNVYFGTYLQSKNETTGEYNKDPIKWRVLANANGELFLLSDQNLDVKLYDESDDYVYDAGWEIFTMRSWLNGYDASQNFANIDYSTDNFLNTAFSADEQDAIATTEVVNDQNPYYQYSWVKTDSTFDRVFLLSLDEVQNTDYGFNSDGFAYDDSRKSTNTAYVAKSGLHIVDEADEWWLRTPGKADNETYVYSDGSISKDGAGIIFSRFYRAVRPAFNLNLDSVLFTSAADFVSGEVGAYTGTEWKLTLKDSTRDSFTASSQSRTKEAVTIEYTNAVANENVSCIITDKDRAEIKYYSTAKVTSASGTVDLSIPETIGENDKMLVFSEQVNGANKTNYASELKEVTIPPAVFAVTANVNSDVMGSVTASKELAKSGESVTLTATANAGYRFVGFESADVKIYTNGNEGVFTMPEKDVTVTASFEAITPESITVKDGEVFDINGEEKTASEINVKTGGKIKDSKGGKGIIKVAKEALYGRNYTDQFPLYDAENGGWRFFDCETGAGYIEGDSSIIGTTLKFKDAETEAIAKRILASDNSGISLDITLSKTDENGAIHKVVCEAPQSVIKNYASNLTKPILMGVSGLKPGITISVNYRFANGLVISKEVSNASPYITLEAGADKSYIVKVYGTALDGVVVVALYNSENQQELIDVKVQKVAEISGQLQGNGEFVKAMWWSDLDVMTPLCDAAGKDLKITTP